MTQKEFSELRDKLLQIYTDKACPAYQEYLNICQSKKCRVDYDAYKALQKGLQPELGKLFAEIAKLKKEVV